LSQKLLAEEVFSVRRIDIVRRAVYFDDQIFRGTVEIDYIRTNALLPSKLPAADPAAFQRVPQETFVKRCVSTQCATEMLLRG